MRILDLEKNSQLTGIHSNKVSMSFPITVPKRTMLSAVIKWMVSTFRIQAWGLTVEENRRR